MKEKDGWTEQNKRLVIGGVKGYIGAIEGTHSQAVFVRRAIVVRLKQTKNKKNKREDEKKI